MTFANPVVEAGVAGLARLFAERAVTPGEAAEVYLSRIERLNPSINAFLSVDAEGARAAAAASSARWAQGQPLSPLDGVPIGVKANIAVANLPWHAGIAAYRERIASADAACVARLRAAGAVILGVLNMHEGALGATTDNPAFGRCDNPHRAGFTPGGSSGGSGSAVAAGLCAAALGTDTMGSVRIPSAYCGVFGHKPARGLVSTEGVIDLSWTLDHVGPHARSAEDCRLVLEALSGASAGSPDLFERPLAVLDYEGQVEVQPGVAAAQDRAVEAARAAGFSLMPLRLSDYDYGAVRRLGLLVSEVEGFTVHEAMLAERPEGFSSAFADGLAWGARQPAPKLARAYRELSRLSAQVRGLLEPYAGLLAPTAPQTAFAFGGDTPANQADFTALANVTGLPATAFPTGVDADGLPTSVQVMSWAEAHGLSVAERLATPIGAPRGFQA
jgi:aspartyl-tRNA(Asn)/glutamyl-tRNA(Gln) amidotransferase subunit A